MSKKYLSHVDQTKINLIKLEGNTLDKIKGNLIYGDEYVRLTKKEQEQLERWNDVFNMMKKGNSPEFIQSHLKRNYHIDAISTVYRDIKMAERLFGEADTINKNAKRLIAIEWTRMSFKMALRMRDVNGMNTATLNYIRAAGLDKEDPETFREEDLQEHAYFAIIQIKDESFELDLRGSGLEKMPKNKATGILQSLYTDIDDVEALEFLENGK